MGDVPERAVVLVFSGVDELFEGLTDPDLGVDRVGAVDFFGKIGLLAFLLGLVHYFKLLNYLKIHDFRTARFFLESPPPLLLRHRQFLHRQEHHRSARETHLTCPDR